MNIEEEMRRIKARRKLTFGDKKQDDNTKKYVNSLITRSLLSVIIFFICIILMNARESFGDFVKEEVFSKNMSFTKIANVYNKYFGSILPFEKLVKDNSTMVFKEKLVYDKIDKYKDGFVLSVEKNYMVPVVQSGVIVFMGEKEGLGNTVIIQGSDEVDYWYSNIDNVSGSLYDYVSKGDVLGMADGEEIYMTFKKDGEYLDFDEVIG